MNNSHIKFKKTNYFKEYIGKLKLTQEQHDYFLMH